MMRIVCFGNSFCDYQIQLANALSNKHETMLAISPIDYVDEHLTRVNDRVVLQVLSRGKRKLSIHPKDFVTFWRFVRKMKGFDPDIVQMQIGGSIADFVFFSFCKGIKKLPVVATFHDVRLHPGDESWVYEFVRYQIRRYSNRIIVHGNRLREEMIRTYKVAPEKVRSIHIGEHEVDLFKRYANDKIEEDGKSILFFGRILPYKGLEFLIQAEPQITAEIPDAKIVIAGEGNFEYYANMTKGRDNFIIHNYRIGYKEGAELFQRASVVVLPYIEASQSGVIPTAFGFKKPVVATAVGSIPEILDDGESGLIVPPRDSNALALAIITLLKDGDLRRKMGENAYEKLKTDFNWEKIASEHIKVYEECLKEAEMGNAHDGPSW